MTKPKRSAQLVVYSEKWNDARLGEALCEEERRRVHGDRVLVETMRRLPSHWPKRSHAQRLK